VLTLAAVHSGMVQWLVSPLNNCKSNWSALKRYLPAGIHKVTLPSAPVMESWFQKERNL
jgi:hypothetical protein